MHYRVFGVTEMKKFISLLIIAATVLSFAACTDTKYKGKVDPNLSQGSVDSMQQSVINSFGVSIDDTWIVGYNRKTSISNISLLNMKTAKKHQKQLTVFIQTVRIMRMPFLKWESITLPQ